MLGEAIRCFFRVSQVERGLCEFLMWAGSMCEPGLWVQLGLGSGLRLGLELGLCLWVCFGYEFPHVSLISSIVFRIWISPTHESLQHGGTCMVICGIRVGCFFLYLGDTLERVNLGFRD